MQGRTAQAIELQQKAMELADESARDAFRKTLESYKAGKLPNVQESPPRYSARFT